MAWPPQIERWRSHAAFESRDIPTDLTLSIIAHESGGQAGVKSQANTKSAEIPTDSGQTVTVSNALGLMQVIPSHVKAWNENKTPIITYEDMTGQDERAARLQIRLGSSIFASYVQKLHKYDPSEFPGTSPSGATKEQLKLSLVAYGIGPGQKGGKEGLIPKLEQLRALKRPLTLESLRVTFPKWGYSEQKGRWINRPVQGATTKWARYVKNAGSKSIIPDKPIKQPGQPGDKSLLAGFDGWLLPALLVGALVFFGEKQK